MKHILLICSRLDLPGGIERATVSAANLFVRKHKVTLLILDETDRSFYPLHKDVTVIRARLHFGMTHAGNVVLRKLSFFRHIQRLRSMLKQIAADIVITTEYPFTIAAQLARPGSSVKIVSWEHHHFHHLRRSRFWEFFFQKAYPKIDCVVCLNSAEAGFYKKMGCSTSVIPNYIEVAEGGEDVRSNCQLLTVGWLSPVKGMDYIPLIAEKVFSRVPGWKWQIIGTGPELDSLLEQIEHRNLSGKIEIAKPVSPNIGSSYLSSSIYVMPSRFECFPYVLLEAMAHGVPCISFNCPTGPSHIIESGEDGFLTEAGNADAMADAIIRLIEDGPLRKKMGEKASENVKRFSPDKVFPLWEQLFSRL